MWLLPSIAYRPVGDKDIKQRKERGHKRQGEKENL